ncbi:DUF567-domain-containing protein [Decorospora gaudefroyi]|uniref:DUF567-domain-containing protein n=1 Tax=Decorospora gaudefroyi TaxID=184978 RepID=A0A6A5KK68_9PLEO|nr:DUF567-domain-containing protein [Decorospora gaudefroyi]
MATPLSPVPQPIGLFPQFFAAAPETIIMKEKVLSLSGDTFHIKLANGTPVLQVQGKVMSMSGRKKMCDMNGNHLLTIAKELFHMHSLYVVEDASGQRVMEVRSSIKLMGSKATATFTSKNGKKESLTMRGDFFDTQADILDEAQDNLVIARIDRKLLSAKDIFLGQQTYGVQIAPGVDIALVAALCICLDEKNNEG